MKTILLMTLVLILGSCGMPGAKKKGGGVVSEFGNTISGTECGQISCLSSRIRKNSSQIITDF